MSEFKNNKRKFYLSVACCLSLPKSLRTLAWKKYLKAKAECEGLR